MVGNKQCQSCGMPLSKDKEKGGSEINGEKSKDYCSHCYQHGEFIDQNITVDQMIIKVKNKLKEYYIPGFLAKYFTKNIPKLKRWQKEQ